MDEALNAAEGMIVNMGNLSLLNILGFILVLVIITLIGIYSGRKIINSEDFTSGGTGIGIPIIIGTIVGTLVGGASTVGTAELAFNHGFSALWFTLGGGIGCLIMGALFSDPFKSSGCRTIQEMIAKEYGTIAGITSSVFGTIGIFINIVAQILAAKALLTTMFNIDQTVASIISAALMAICVVFGGVIGTGMVGVFKTCLLYLTTIFGGILAIKLSGGLSELYSFFPKDQYFNLVGRGIGKDLGAGLSLILGVLTTQTYVQAVLSAKDNRTARVGAYLSAIIIPPIGLMSVFVGLRMKMQFPDILPCHAFPQFIINSFPQGFGGVALGTLLIAVVGTGAGLSLGISSIGINDLYHRIKPESKNDLFVSRLIILVVMIIACMFTFGGLGSVILDWSFMSMGLRAAVSFFPMVTSLFMPNRINHRFIILGIILAPISMIVAKLFFSFNFDVLFLGMIVSLITVILGGIFNHSKKGV